MFIFSCISHRLINFFSSLFLLVYVWRHSSVLQNPSRALKKTIYSWLEICNPIANENKCNFYPLEAQILRVREFELPLPPPPAPTALIPNPQAHTTHELSSTCRTVQRKIGVLTYESSVCFGANSVHPWIWKKKIIRSKLQMYISFLSLSIWACNLKIFNSTSHCELENTDSL